jgi:hypothetical protein
MESLLLQRPPDGRSLPNVAVHIEDNSGDLGQCRLCSLEYEPFMSFSVDFESVNSRDV